MDPGSAILAGAGVSALGSVAGGAIAGHGARKAMRMQLDHQRFMAMHGVAMRVADAQRSGVHPLYALGAQLPQFAPVAVQTDDLGRGIAEASGRIGEGVERYARWKLEREDRAMAATRAGQEDMLRMHAITNERLRTDMIGSQIAEHDALAAESRSRTLQNVLQINKERMALLGSGGDAVERVVPEVFAGGASEMATRVADKAWKPFQITSGGAMLDLPSDPNAGMAQALEGVEGLVPAALVVQHNLRKYGRDWAARVGGSLYGLGQKYGPSSLPARAFRLLQIYREHGWDAMLKAKE